MNIYEKYPDLPIPDYEKDYAALCAAMLLLRDKDPAAFRDACVYFLSKDLIGAFNYPDIVEQISRKLGEISTLTGGNLQTTVFRLTTRYPIYPERVTP